MSNGPVKIADPRKQLRYEGRMHCWENCCCLAKASHGYGGGKGEIVVAAEVSSDLGKYCDGQVGIRGLGYVISCVT